MLNTSRDEMIEILADKYVMFLNSLHYDDEFFMVGIREGKNKFFANLHIHLAIKNVRQINKNIDKKHYSTDFVTPDALEVLKGNSNAKLTYEHLVPKKKYIQDPCEKKAKEGKLTFDFAKGILNRYLWTATVTKMEDERLLRSTMPDGWDEANIQSRYEYAGIELLSHDKFYQKCSVI